jgi:hypothetical protein
MIRLVIENIILFLLPTLAYVIFVMLRRSQERDNTVARTLDSAPLPLLFSVGFILMIAVLGYFGSQSSGGKPGQTYLPPEIVDGKLKPGRFE